MSLSGLPPAERPRERLAREGAERLSDAELLAILLRTGGGAGRGSVLELAASLLQRHGGLEGLATATVEELGAQPGVGQAKAATLRAAFELGRRRSLLDLARRPAIGGPSDAARLLGPLVEGLDREHFYALLLNAKHQVLAQELISVGDLTGSLVHPRELFKRAIRRSAAAVILGHNHPSGDPTPSPEDWGITRRLVEGGRLLGIEILDHVILGDKAWVSLRDQGAAYWESEGRSRC